MIFSGEDTEFLVIDFYEFGKFEQFGPIKGVEVSKLAMKIDTLCFGVWPIDELSCGIVVPGRYREVYIARETRHVGWIVPGCCPTFYQNRLDALLPKDPEDICDL